MNNTATVVISTFDRKRFNSLLSMLVALKNQTVKNFDVIIIINEDKWYYRTLFNTIKYKLNISYKVLTVFLPKDNGIAYARNSVIEDIRTPYIIYTDDDTCPDEKWLEQLIGSFNNPIGNIGAVVGAVIPDWNYTYNSRFPKEFYWIIGYSDYAEGKRIVRNGFCSNLAIKKDILVKIGGFNEDFGYKPKRCTVGEDTVLGIDLFNNGYVTLYNPKAVVYHEIAESRLKLKKLTYRAFAEGRTKAIIRNIYGNDMILYEKGHLQKIISLLLFKPLKVRSKILFSFITLIVLIGFLCFTKKIY